MRERQPYDEAAASIRWKLGGDLASVQLDDLATDVQPQPEPTLIAVAVSLVETLEDQRPIFWRYTRPVIADRYFQSVIRR